jgi:hypothetical protein
MAEGGDFVLFGGDLEGFDDTLGGGGHISFIGVKGVRFVNDEVRGLDLGI